MIEIIDPITFNFENLPIDPFWNTSEDQELLMHKIHAYPAKFPAFLTTKALSYANEQSVNVRVIADIFCGCGTTAYEAKRNNIDFWGCDINPVATLIAQTKSKIYEREKLLGYLKSINEIYQNKPLVNRYETADARLKYWFKEHEYNNLASLKEAIYRVVPVSSDYLNFFICAFSNILKSTSSWLTKSIKPQIDPNKKAANVISAYNKQCNFMILANEQNEKSYSSTNIETINFLAVKKVPKIDFIITSPPYVTSYEYADLHQLSSLWLNYADDYRELRAGSIGSLHHEYNFNREFKKLNISGNKIVSRLINQKNPKAKSIAKYFLDMQEVTNKSYQIINNNGLALFVIGNTEYQGIIIENARHLAESLLDAGFKSINITKRKISKKNLTPYRDSLGKFTTNTNGRRIYNEEFIIIGRK